MTIEEKTLNRLLSHYATCLSALKDCRACQIACPYAKDVSPFSTKTNGLRKVLVVIFALWALFMGLTRVCSARLDRMPLPIELQDTCMTGPGLCQDPEEVCINGQCEAEQD